MSDIFELGDRVTMTGTVEKKQGYGWRRAESTDLFDGEPVAPSQVYYADAGLPGFHGYAWTKPVDESATFHPRTEGVIVGKRQYRSMENDEGIWIPDGKQDFTAYLVAWHLNRAPVIARPNQIERLNTSGDTQQ